MRDDIISYVITDGIRIFDVSPSCRRVVVVGRRSSEESFFESGIYWPILSGGRHRLTAIDVISSNNRAAARAELPFNLSPFFLRLAAENSRNAAENHRH